MTVLLIQVSPYEYDFYSAESCSSLSVNQYINVSEDTIGKIKCKFENESTNFAKRNYQLIENTVLKETYEFPKLNGTLSVNQFYASLNRKIEKFFEVEKNWKITDFFVDFKKRKIVFIFTCVDKLNFKMIRNLKTYLKYFSFKFHFSKQTSKNEKWNDFVDDNYGQWNDISIDLQRYFIS